MSSETVVTLLKSMEGTALAGHNILEGCSESELKEIEAIAEAKLPEEYRTFMAVLGRFAGDFLSGSDYLYPDVLKVKKYAEELLEESEVKVTIPKTAFPFFMHQGYLFMYFDCASGDNPPVWRFMEGYDEPLKIADSFSEWLQDAISAELQLSASVNNQ